ncbi:MAG: hypothetical protein MH204_08025 [Fimbriimonadaceae bacterium]|nr:hypothetical protein [Fimbriimonadaceae bacterium]
MESPQLWWPNGLGEQPLYTLRTELRRGEEVLDSVVRRIGLRTIELDQTPDADGSTFGFIVNGHPIFAAGSNWIPDHSFPGIVSRERIFEQVARAKATGHVMLRIWGGGVYESEDFYDACDEMGILVWQDFPYACAHAPDDESDRAVIRAEAAVNISRLQWRTSLAIWCGNNENHTMFDSKWGGAENCPERLHGAVIWEEDLPAVAAEHDGTRACIISSPFGTPGHHNGDDMGDCHNWRVWHGGAEGGTWELYADSHTRFCSEFGFCSAPSLPLLESVLAPEDHDPRSNPVRWHDKSRKGYETYLGFVEPRFGPIHTLEDLVRFTQINQRDAMRFALSHYRTNEKTRGALIWQFNDCWPVQCWSMVDFSGRIKPAGEEMARCFAPALAAVLVRNGEVSLRLANDSREEASGDVLVTVFDTAAASVVGRWSFPGQTLAPGERRTVREWRRDELGGPSLVMKVEWAPAESLVIRLQDSVLTERPQPELTIEQDAEGRSFLRIEKAALVDGMFVRDEVQPSCLSGLPGDVIELRGLPSEGAGLWVGDQVIQLAPGRRGR